MCFAHDPPADRSVHERVLGRNVEFGHDFNGIVCARSDLEAPNPNADPELARLARKLLDTESAAQGGTTSADVRKLVVMLLPTGGCSIDRAAQHLGVDRRTVHRRLLREGHTFSSIVEKVREELAERYLKDRRRSLADVSSLLGFATPSGFSHWYRRRFKAKSVEAPHGSEASRPLTGLPTAAAWAGTKATAGGRVEPDQTARTASRVGSTAKSIRGEGPACARS